MITKHSNDRALASLSVIIVYVSISGNTQEVAQMLAEELERHVGSVNLYNILGNEPFPDVQAYDAMLIGSYTWENGQTPFDVKDFVADLGYKPENVFVFGTGDTQFGGDDTFCLAADKLAKFYHSPLPPLKVEQSPRGEQEQEVSNWMKGVLTWLS
ncbi:flavodoxin [Sediminibacillus sp. JSM 1682029]|uniref:flavodoxin n=1 Tax=Sediminibacillus sp. JSM 1682029 TaxID=3229857 RepID=UPI003523E2C0